MSNKINSSLQLTKSIHLQKALDNFPILNNQHLNAVIDSGASSHFIPNIYDNKSLILPGSIQPNEITITQADGKTTLKSTHSCTLTIRSDNKKHAMNGSIHLYDTYIVPGLQRALISVPKLTTDGYEVLFCNGQITISKNDLTLLEISYRLFSSSGSYFNDLFYIPHRLFHSYSKHSHALITTTHKEPNPLLNLHLRLGHLNFDRCKQIYKLLYDKPIHDRTWCSSCAMTKSHKVSYPKSSRHIATRPLERVSTDICGPFHTKTMHNEKYFVVFLDHYTNYSHIELLRSKGDFEDAFLRFLKVSNNIHQPHQLTYLYSDNAMDTNRMHNISSHYGIQQIFTAPYSSVQNGRAERLIRSLTESAQAMRYHSGLPNQFWGYAISYANLIRNTLPSINSVHNHSSDKNNNNNNNNNDNNNNNNNNEEEEKEKKRIYLIRE